MRPVFACARQLGAASGQVCGLNSSGLGKVTLPESVIIHPRILTPAPLPGVGICVVAGWVVPLDTPSHQPRGSPQSFLTLLPGTDVL